MSNFHVIEITGKFVVKNNREVLAVMDSREAAEFACQQLNYEPGRNPCDAFMRGRWTQRPQKQEAA